MGSLGKALAKEGIKVPKKESAKAKATTPILACDKPTTKAVDGFLSLSRDIKGLEVQLAKHADTIRVFGMARALDEKSPDTVALQGETGAVQITIKEQFSIKDEAQFGKMAKEFGEEFVTQTDEIAIDYSKMTAEEQKAMVKFIKNTFNADRVEKLIKEVPKFKTNGLCAHIFEQAASVEQMAEWRQLSGHHSPSVQEYKKANQDE